MARKRKFKSERKEQTAKEPRRDTRERVSRDKYDNERFKDYYVKQGAWETEPGGSCTPALSCTHHLPPQATCLPRSGTRSMPP